MCRYSIRLIEPLLGAHSNEALEHPVWNAWKAHVAYFEALCAESFTMASIDHVERLISIHQELLEKVRGYRRIPKHHFIKHVPCDIIKFGPPVRSVPLSMATAQSMYRKSMQASPLSLHRM